MTLWYYSDPQRNRLGPIAADALAELHRDGTLRDDTLVWRDGLPQWRTWREMQHEVLGTQADGPAPSAATAPLSADVSPYALAETAPAASAADAATLSAGVNPYAAADDSASPYAPPRAAVGATAVPVTGAEVVYAGFWKRFAAYAIDSFVVAIATWIVQVVVLMGLFGLSLSASAGGDPSEAMAGAGMVGLVLGMFLVPLAMQAVYFAWMHSSGKQATLGKMAVGIKVTDDAGETISFLRGIGRFFATIISSLTLCIGYIMAGFTDRKRALHDMVASTLVVDQWAFTAHPERQRHELGTVTIVILAIAGVFIVGYLLLILAAIGMGLASGN